MKIVKIFINLTLDRYFIVQLKTLGFASRIYELLKQYVKQDLGNEQTTGESNSAQLKEGEGVFELNKKDFKVDSQTGKVFQIAANEQLIEYSFMLISNFTADEAGQKHMLGVEGNVDAKHQFIILESIFGMFCYFNKNTIFDFVSNIVSNLACLAQAR